MYLNFHFPHVTFLMKSQNRKLSFPIVEADPLHHSGFLSESECGNEMREGELRTRTRVITDKTFHSLIVCLCYDNKIVFKTSQQCTVEMYGDKLEFLIKALWIAHFREWIAQL